MTEQIKLDQQIYIAQAQLGLTTPQEIALEASRLIDPKFFLTGVIVGYPHIERMFGKKAWLGHLNARKYLTTQGRDQPRSVEYMSTVHRLYLEPTQTQGAGLFRSSNYRGGEEDEYTPIRLTPTQRLALQTHPIADFEQEGDDPNKGYIIYPDYKTIPKTFAEIIADHERQRGQPHDPFVLHSGTQRRLIGLHVWDVDMNGRTTRAIMNDGLERDGKPPSSPFLFSDDLYASSKDWRDSVKRGSAWFQRAWERIAEGAQDLVTIFDLEEHRAYYLAMQDKLRAPAITASGDINNIAKFDIFLSELEHGVQVPLIDQGGREPVKKSLSNLREVKVLLERMGCEHVTTLGDANTSLAGVQWTIATGLNKLGIKETEDMFVTRKSIVFSSGEDGSLRYHLEINGTKMRTDEKNKVSSEVIEPKNRGRMRTPTEATYFFLWDFAGEPHSALGPEEQFGFQFYNGMNQVDRNVEVSIAGVMFTFKPTSQANGVLGGRVTIQAPIL